MDVKTLAIAIHEMRRLQKEYFATRNKFILEESKKKEREVDSMIDEITRDFKQGDLGL